MLSFHLHTLPQRDTDTAINAMPMLKAPTGMYPPTFVSVVQLVKFSEVSTTRFSASYEVYHKRSTTYALENGSVSCVSLEPSLVITV